MTDPFGDEKAPEITQECLEPPKRAYYDIEANGFLKEVSKVHCLCISDLDSDLEWVFGPDRIEEGVRFLEQIDLIVGHNSIRYDLPVLRKLHDYQGKVGQSHKDTLVLARLKHPNIKVTDKALVEKKQLHSSLHGKDSLKAWGQRVGIHKTDYDGGFDEWSQEMQDYCAQDVRTGKALWVYLHPEEMDPFCVDVEHRIAEVTNLMEYEGWPFDSPAAQKLHVELVERYNTLEKSLVAKYGQWQEIDKVFVAKVNNTKRGIKKGDTVTNYKTVVFNPGSRMHIEKKLREAGWEPLVFTESGRAKLDEDVLEALDVPEAKELVEYLLIQKRIGALAGGENAWLKLLCDQGRIHASYNCMGTVTGRASHYNPNIAQVPKVLKDKVKGILLGEAGKWGAECRALFMVPKGWKLVGADFEGLELRCLAHFLALFDGGRYADLVINGDVHTLTMEAAGLSSRDLAKTFIYAFLYGAGDEKLGKIVGKGRKAGKRLKEQFLKNFPALRKLREKVATAAKRGYLIGLDGRHIPVRSAHAALNSLLQSMGAVLCKNWVVDTYDALIALGLKHGWNGDFVMVGWIHDEIQIAVREGLQDQVGAIMVSCAQKQTQRFGLKVRLDSKFIVGDNWKDTH